MDVRADVDFPAHFFSLAENDETKIDSDYETGVGTHDLLGEIRCLLSIHNEDFELIERPSFFEAVTAVTLSTVKQPYFEYSCLYDLVPFFVSPVFRIMKHR